MDERDEDIPGLPPHTYVSSVLASKHAAGRVYATFDGHFNNDENTYVYASTDFGQSWRKITNGLPQTTVNRIAEHPRSANLIVIGDALGVHFSNDTGASWHSLSTNMPTVPVRSVVFQSRDNALVAGSYARGIWVLDDVGPLEKLTPAAMQADAVLTSITRGKQITVTPLGTRFGVADFYAPNPSFDPIISFYLRDTRAGATITISDASGRKVRTLRGPAQAGLNRATWDMRFDSAMPGNADGASAGGGRGGGRGGDGGASGLSFAGADANAGPLVAPGQYTVSVAIQNVATPLRGQVTVSADPLEKLSPADRQERQLAIMEGVRPSENTLCRTDGGTIARCDRQPMSSLTSPPAALWPRPRLIPS